MSLPRSGRGRTRGVAVLTAMILAVWVAHFWPVLAQKKNLLGCAQVPARVTGIELGARRLAAAGADRDDSQLWTHFPYQAFLAREFGRGHFPLWNPDMGCGQPVSSDPQYKPFNPFFWPFFASPSAWVFSLGIAAMALWGAFGFTLSLREVGLWPLPAAVGGLLMAFNPFTLQAANLSSSWVVWTGAWGLWGLQCWRGGKGCGLPVAAGAGALAALSGHPVIAALWTLGLGVAMALDGGSRNLRSRAAGMGMLWACVALLAAVQVLPFLWDLNHYASYKASWSGGPFGRWWDLADPRAAAYVPVPIAGLALGGLASGRRGARLCFALAAVYGGLLMFDLPIGATTHWCLSLGGTLVGKYGEVPYWVGLSGLSALGIEAMDVASRERVPWRAGRLFLLGVALAYLLAWVSIEVAWTIPWMSVYSGLALLEGTVAVLVAVTYFALSRTRFRNGACWACALVLAVPFALPGGIRGSAGSRDILLSPPAAASYMADAAINRDPFRISGRFDPKARGLADLCPNQAMAWGLSDVRITSPIILSRYSSFAQHWGTSEVWETTTFFPRQDLALLRFLGVRFKVSDAKTSDASLDPPRGAGPLAVQEVPGAMPWVRPAASWEVAAGPDDALRRTFLLLRSEGWRDRVVLEEVPASATNEGGGGRVSAWLERGPDNWGWTVESPSPFLLVVLQNHHPGWTASVDGRPTKLLRAYGTFMVLEVPGGTHEVHLEFRSPAFRWGMAVSAVAWVGLIGWGWAGWRRRRPEPCSPETPGDQQ